jgi:hypothetical protein
MNLLKLVFQLFVLYLLYKLVFELIIPVYRTTKHIKKNMDSMAREMEQRQPNSVPKEQETDKGEYIDYEEVK